MNSYCKPGQAVLLLSPTVNDESNLNYFDLFIVETDHIRGTAALSREKSCFLKTTYASKSKLPKLKNHDIGFK